MLRDNLVGLIEPMPTARENHGSSLALSIHKHQQASDDRSSCLKNPRPAGAESSLTERTTPPFQTEPRQRVCLPWIQEISSVMLCTGVTRVRVCDWLLGWKTKRKLMPFPKLSPPSVKAWRVKP